MLQNLIQAEKRAKVGRETLNTKWKILYLKTFVHCKMIQNEQLSIVHYSNKGFFVFSRYCLTSLTHEQQQKDKQISISSFYMTNSKFKKLSAWFNSYAATVIMFPA